MCIDGSPVLTVKDINSLTVRHYTKEDKTRLKKKATRSHLFAYIIIAVWLILFTVLAVLAFLNGKDDLYRLYKMVVSFGIGSAIYNILDSMKDIRKQKKEIDGLDKCYILSPVKILPKEKAFDALCWYPVLGEDEVNGYRTKIYLDRRAYNKARKELGRTGKASPVQISFNSSWEYQVDSRFSPYAADDDVEKYQEKE